MARTQKLQFNDIATWRRARGENQKQFWERFGITQSGGSRYENGRDIPDSAALLLALYHRQIITDADLAQARKIIDAR